MQHKNHHHRRRRRGVQCAFPSGAVYETTSQTANMSVLTRHVTGRDNIDSMSNRSDNGARLEQFKCSIALML